MSTLFTLQLALPLIFVLWFGIAPPRSLLGFWIQLLATATGLTAIGLTGLWLWPPWWAPYVFGVVLLLVTLTGLRRRSPFASVLPLTVGAWTVAALFVGLGGVALDQAALALAGRAPPPGRLVELQFPLAQGTYLIVNGGSDIRVNAHMKTLDASIARFHAWRGQSYGIDIVKINRFGLRASGLQPAEAGAYLIYGTKVLAPCSGEVVFAIDGLPDMKIPETDRVHMAGNHLILRCGDADVLLGHLQPGSLQVPVGARVRVGDWVGAVGNSGNTDEPHLHIHAQQPATTREPMSGNPLPVSFSSRVLVRNDRVSVP